MRGKKLYTSAQNWGCEQKERVGMLLFVQRVREILLHTSSLPCKPIIASPFVVAREIFSTLDQNSRSPHRSVEPNIKCLVDELDESVRIDPIAKIMIGDRAVEIRRALLDFSRSAAQIEASRFLLGRLKKENYQHCTTSRIIEIIENGGVEKKELLALCEGFVACIRHFGYPAQTIYHLLNVFFFDHEKQKMTARARLEAFFSKFDFVKHKHDVYFSIEDLAANVSETFGSITADFWQEGSEEFSKFIDALPLRTRGFFSATTSAGILKFKDVEALDPQSARVIAERRLRLLDDLLRFSVHGGRFVVKNPSLIWREKFGYVHSNRPRRPILLVPHDSDVQHSSLSRLALALRSLRSSQAQRFVRAIELHGTALSANEEESQLLNLWIALETLFVSGQDSKVVEVINAVTPYVIGAWNNYLFAELWDRIVHVHFKLWTDSIKSSPDLVALSDMKQLVMAISLKKFEPEMTEFLKNLDDDPLFRQKIVNCIEWAKSPKEIKRYREVIRRKVEFDISRIYRARNRIVHIGLNSEGMADVVQLAHFYLDLSLTILSVLFSSENGVRSVEQANLEVAIIDNGLTMYLDSEIKKGSILDEKSCFSLLFGRPLMS
jgi:VanZ family protein